MIQLCDKLDCTGCGACYQACPKQAISMDKDAEGFLYPVIHEENCVECKLCQRVCPILKPILKHEVASKPLAVVAKSENVRMLSSSGGMFSVLSSYVFSQNGVVFGAVMDGSSHEVYHTKAENEEELSVLRGSKYVQSSTMKTFQEVKAFLQKGRMVLFTGTPCQIAGLYAFLRRVDVSLLFTVDLVCHGTPSVQAFSSCLQKLSEKVHCSISDIKDFRFRDLNGWDITPSYVIRNDKIENVPVSKSLFMKLFLGSYLHRESCYRCKYTSKNRMGDITLADFWGIGADKPFNYDTSKGCSLVLVNSDKGKELFSALSDQIYYEEREWPEALAQNHQLQVASLRPKGRDMVYAYMNEHTYDEINKRFFNTPYLRFRRFVGTLLRMFHLR